MDDDDRKLKEKSDFEYESFRDIKKPLNDDDDEKDLDDEFKLPEMNWERLEAQLKEANEEMKLENQRRSSYIGNLSSERDEIRRKLATVSQQQSSSFSSFNNDQAKSYASVGGQLQICFMNESINDEDSAEEEGGDDEEQIAAVVESDDHLDEETENENKNDKSSSSDTSYHQQSTAMLEFTTFSFNTSTNTCEEILLKLQHGAQMELTHVRQKVRRLMDAEKKKMASTSKPSPIADIVGLPTYGIKRLERENIVDMNIGQLQVIVNDLCNQIEKINEELKKLLIERDDLYMKQDAILVDIEDITKRIQEFSIKKKQSLNALSNLKGRHHDESSHDGHPTSSLSSSSMASTAASKLLKFSSSLTNKLYHQLNNKK